MAELTTCNATRKALDVARRRPGAVVLGADTLVSLEGKTIGKPADLLEAVQILQRLRGREHQVCTAVFLCAARRRLTMSFHVISHVRFRHLSDRKIRAYLDKVDPLDKAGAYAAQGHGAEIIAEIEGSFTNVVGLPMDETKAALGLFGIEPRS
jgi:septum formation protein